MTTYTTCPACGFLMTVADTDYTVHPNCDEPANPRRDLEQAWLEHVKAGEDAEADQLAGIIDRQAPPPRLLDAALLYAGWGWPVFPLRPGLKVPATTNGFKDASTDLDQIRAWWDATPKANIGLPTGGSFDVIDIDAPTGWGSYAKMQDTDALPDVHGVVSTAGAGLHLYVKPHPGRRSAAGTLPGIDIRATGGYIVAPPSVDYRGYGYLWRHKPSPILTGQVAT